MKRRDLLRMGGVVAVIVGAQAWFRNRPRAFDFEPIGTLPGFRRVSYGPVSRTDDVLFVGLDRPSAEEEALQAAARFDPCRAVFPDDPGEKLPMAVFTDYFCPYCPEMSETAIRVAGRDHKIRLVWHDLPIFGPRSEETARTVLAAGQQGAYVDAHRYLMHNRIPPGPAGLGLLAERFGLDPEQLETDADGPKVRNSLQRSRAAAAVLGIPGTPAILIGRTLAIGRLSADDLERLVELERERALPDTCQG